ncbi:hypothetical protein HF313_01920 [Massilia atriviolacea]|uniref:Uncharacterized protein n=1 Tax=Massilia atriviolacea TaxID=2495579 RepID=A0A430HNR5_9BURK|nr:hypothetical protein [Massilia atriviolacea]RSZ59185.1 hypothetical protein EJB06_08315 [Massilia atriviolacea]
MIELTEAQEGKILRRDCRGWIELMAQAWYESGHAGADAYPGDALITHLRAVYDACRDANMENMDDVSLLGFNVLRANTARCGADDVTALVDYFIRHARSGNAAYAQAWIDLYLEEA